MKINKEKLKLLDLRGQKGWLSKNKVNIVMNIFLGHH